MPFFLIDYMHFPQSPLCHLSLPPPSAPSTPLLSLFDTHCHTVLASAPCTTSHMSPHTFSQPYSRVLTLHRCPSPFSFRASVVCMLCLCPVSCHVVCLTGQLPPTSSWMCVCVVGWGLVVALPVSGPLVSFSPLFSQNGILLSASRFTCQSLVCYWRQSESSYTHGLNFRDRSCRHF